MGTVYLNGAYLPKEEAFVSVDDRGFLFGDGVYEVTPVYRGVPFRLGRHLDRMRFGLGELGIRYGLEEVEEVHHRLVRLNGLEGEEAAIVYYQVTRGAAPRSHLFPDPPVPPTVYAYAAPYRRRPGAEWKSGYAAVTAPDRRWARVDVKAVTLLPNVLALQAASEAGAGDVILVREGVAVEGAHSNLFAVFGGVVTTHPLHRILAGITRECVLELCGALGLAKAERPIQVEELFRADEIFFTGTTSEVRPVVKVDGRPVGTGAVGPVTRRLYAAFLETVSASPPASPPA